MPEHPPLEFYRKGRTWTTLLALLGTWIVLLLIWTVLNAAWWIVAFFFLFTLPALRDIWMGTSAGARLTDRELSWFTGNHEVELPVLPLVELGLDAVLLGDADAPDANIRTTPQRVDD